MEENKVQDVKLAEAIEQYLWKDMPWWTKLPKVCAFVLFIVAIANVAAVRFDVFPRKDPIADIIITVLAAIVCATLGNVN